MASAIVRAVYIAWAGATVSASEMYDVVDPVTRLISADVKLLTV